MLANEDRVWWSYRSSIVLLTRWMFEQTYPASEIVRAVEKPWNYEREFRQALAETIPEQK